MSVFQWVNFYRFDTSFISSNNVYLARIEASCPTSHLFLILIAFSSFRPTSSSVRIPLDVSNFKHTLIPLLLIFVHLSTYSPLPLLCLWRDIPAHTSLISFTMFRLLDSLSSEWYVLAVRFWNAY